MTSVGIMDLKSDILFELFRFLEVVMNKSEGEKETKRLTFVEEAVV